MDDVRPPNKVTDYPSSSSEDSDTTDEDDDEEVDQEAGEESTSGPEDSRAVYVHNVPLHFQSRIHRFGLMDEIMLLLSRDAF